MINFFFRFPPHTTNVGIGNSIFYNGGLSPDVSENETMKNGTVVPCGKIAQSLEYAPGRLTGSRQYNEYE